MNIHRVTSGFMWGQSRLALNWGGIYTWADAEEFRAHFNICYPRNLTFMDFYLQNIKKYIV